MRRLVRIVAAVVAVLVIAVIALVIALWHSPTPTTPGPDAEALAHDMIRAVDGDAWARTGAVRWRSPNAAHLWDRQRGLARVEWRGHRVLIDTASKRGRAWNGEREVDGAEKDALVDKAYRLWINDSFWLNPIVKAFDDGTSRSLGRLDGKRALQLKYASGGVTPGDTYLWIVGDDNRPVAWRLWVQILHVKGLEISWEGWTRLPTGAWVATMHKILGTIPVVTIKDLAAGATLHDIEPNDPFGPILTAR